MHRGAAGAAVASLPSTECLRLRAAGFWISILLNVVGRNHCRELRSKCLAAIFGELGGEPMGVYSASDSFAGIGA